MKEGRCRPAVRSGGSSKSWPECPLRGRICSHASWSVLLGDICARPKLRETCSDATEVRI